MIKFCSFLTKFDLCRTFWQRRNRRNRIRIQISASLFCRLYKSQYRTIYWNFCYGYDYNFSYCIFCPYQKWGAKIEKRGYHSGIFNRISFVLHHFSGCAYCYVPGNFSNLFILLHFQDPEKQLRLKILNFEWKQSLSILNLLSKCNEHS